MRVTRIEVFGFKSFMDRLVLPLEGGVTGVVGPNGCGKSNIVDAIRWVLGETRASSLRGDSLEDVIFNGTDKLRPLGLAEVTLTIRATDQNLFADLVSSSLEAEGIVQDVQDSVLAEEEAEQIAEPAPAATQEVQKTDETAENGRPVLTVIQGGQSEPGSALPTGEETESAPQNHSMASTLLSRFSWLKAVSEVQVTRRLYRSGESEFFINRVPCRLKDMKELFRAVGLSARAYTIVAQGEVSRIVTSKPTDRRLILEDAAGILGFRDKIGSAQRRLSETEINISRIDDITKEVQRQVTVLKRQAARAEGRQGLKDRLTELERALFRDSFLGFHEKLAAIEQALASSAGVEANLEATLQRAQAADQEARGELVTIDVAGDDLRSKIDAIKEELNNRARQRQEKQGRVSELKAYSLARETEVRRLEERRGTLDSRQAECSQSIATLRQREEELSKEIASIDTAGGQEELKKIASALDDLRQELRRKEQEIRAERDNLISKQSSLEAIDEQIIAASPVSQLKKSLGEQSVGALAGSSASLLVDGLKVPEKYAVAAQAVLAERAQFLVSGEPYRLAQQFIEQIIERPGMSGQGRGQQKGLGLGVFRAGTISAAATVSLNVPFPRLLDQIEVSDTVRLAAVRTLGAVYVAETLAEAIGFFEANTEAQQSEIVLVTVSGDIVTGYSFFSLRHEGGVIQLRNRAESLRQECAVLQKKNDGLAAEREAVLARIAQAEEQHRAILRDLQERQTKVRELVNQQGTVRGRFHTESRLLEQLRQDLEKTAQQGREAQVKIEELKAEHARVEQEIAALVPDEEQQLHQELRGLSTEYGTLDQQRKLGREKLAQVASQLDACRRELDQRRTDTGHQQLEKQRVELELGHLAERVRNEYGTDAETQVFSTVNQDGRLAAETRSEYQEETQQLRNRINREGDVDPTSIDRYREESARLEDLLVQKRDLDTAAATLKRTIERLTVTSVERFTTIFEAVRRNFTDLVPRLFGGGKGDLQLTDPSNPLESGIDIIARPPGKKLKSIELLSGGEKALCATALIFSMFKERPSPLCVLDEVDAPLDEANLARFLGMVKEMSAKTQFLLVTHNKASMAVADSLVGVTMQEPGASKVITVSLQDAYSAVA